MSSTGVGKISKELVKTQGKAASKKVSPRIEEETNIAKESLTPERLVKAMSPKTRKPIKELGTSPNLSKTSKENEELRSQNASLVLQVGLLSNAIIERETIIEEYDSSLQSLTKFLDTMKRNHDNDMREVELEHIEDRTDLQLYRSRQQEIMDVFIEATKNKIAYEKKLKSEKRPKKEKKPEFTVKPTKGIVGTVVDVAKATGKAVVETAKKVYQNRTAIVSAGAFVVGALSKGIEAGESKGAGGYNAANMGTRNNKIVPVKGKLNLEDMTVEEIMKRQSIPWGASNESDKLFAVGKYQMIPTTLNDAVKKLNINPKEKFTKELQERLFKDYLLSIKRPAISRYLNSPVDDPKLLNDALVQLSLEWASFADPNIPGGTTSHYGRGNKASVTVEQAKKMLQQDRQSNLERIKPIQENVVGEKMSSMSVENSEMKKELAKSVTSTAIIQQNTINNVVNKTNMTTILEDNNTNPMLGR